jgi:MATE family multidrug resistance protein
MLGSFTPSTADLRALLRLAVPIATVQLGIMLMGVVGTVYVGHVSATELAGAALGNLYIYAMFGFGMGTLWAVDPIVSQALGAKDHDGASLGVQRGLVLGVILSVVMMLACIPAGWVLHLLREPVEVVPVAARYARLAAPGLIPMLTFVTLRQSLQAMKRPQGVVIAIAVSNVANIVLHEMLVNGRWGFEPRGATGSALALVVARFTMLGALLVFARRDLDRVLQPWRRAAFERGPLLRTLRLGLPIGAQTSIEYATFATISLLAGWFGAASLAGHQVAIHLASLMYTVPMGVGSAASVLVGRAIGANDIAHARRVAASALLCGPAFMALSACMMLAFAPQLAAAWTSVPDVAAVAASLIPIAGVFQVFDGVQVVSAGVLRGAADTRAALIANLMGFWLVGLPVSVLLGFRAGLGVQGLWWGFVAGLAAVALFLVLRVRRVLARPVERVIVDAGSA